MDKNQHINGWNNKKITTIDIPIIIDDVKNYPKFKMTRCTYFTIESDVPSPNWELHLKTMLIPFFLLGISGIIYKPIGGKDLFDKPDKIDELFNIIEEHPSLYIDINDIWFPNSLLTGPKSRGQVYRVKDRLFNHAFLYRQQKISNELFLEHCREFKDDVEYSEIESKVFHKWADLQISQAKNLYPKNPKYRLKIKQNNSEGMN